MLRKVTKAIFTAAIVAVLSVSTEVDGLRAGSTNCDPQFPEETTAAPAVTPAVTTTAPATTTEAPVVSSSASSSSGSYDDESIIVPEEVTVPDVDTDVSSQDGGPFSTATLSLPANLTSDTEYEPYSSSSDASHALETNTQTSGSASETGAGSAAAVVMIAVVGVALAGVVVGVKRKRDAARLEAKLSTPDEMHGMVRPTPARSTVL